jgi:branched-chain amino acid transport system substrate-binding protein
MKKTFAKTAGICSVCFVLMLTLFAGISFEAMAADTVKIGNQQPMTGPMEAYGRAFAAGFQFVVDEQNAKGGLLGKKVEVITEDNEFKPDVGVRKAKKLILENKVNFLANAMGSHIAIALNKVAGESKTLFFHYGAMADGIMGKEFNRYTFRTTTNIYNLNAAQALLLATTPYRKLYSINMDFVSGHETDRLSKELIKRYVPDVTWVGTDFHPIGTKDFGPYITKIIASKADAIFSGTYGPDFINMVKTARVMGLKAPFPIFNALAKHPYLLNDLKDDAVGIHWSHEYSLRVKTPENEEIMRKYHEQHKNDRDFLTWWPSSDTAMALLGWKMIFAAVEKAGSLDPEKIIETFENNFQWKSPVGLWTMRKCDHQVILPVFAGVIEGGPNPFYKFPWAGPKIIECPADKIALPPTPDYNSRCP